MIASPIYIALSVSARLREFGFSSTPEFMHEAVLEETIFSEATVVGVLREYSLIAVDIGVLRIHHSCSTTISSSSSDNNTLVLIPTPREIPSPFADLVSISDIRSNQCYEDPSPPMASSEEIF